MAGPLKQNMGLLQIFASVIFFAFLGANIVTATHFRYGTISWCSTKVQGRVVPNSATFKMALVYKRDYDWGQWYSEKWSPDNGTSWYNTTGKNSDGVDTWQNFNPGVDYSQWRLMFPVGMGPYGTPLRRGQLQCSSPLVNAGNPDPSQSCSPWSETVGWFYGDGTHETTILIIDQVVFEQTHIGNYISGHAEFVHTYPRASYQPGQPWLAYFTGGNRLSDLHNNHDGRYRLETTVYLEKENCSPIATNLPVLPLPYIGRAQRSTYGYMSTFQIAAYDPDIRYNKDGTDSLSFRIGSRYEFGYLLQHSARRLDDIQWTKEQWDAEVAAIIADARSTGQPIPTQFGWDYQPAGWDNDNDYAHPPDNIDIESSSGVVTWETGINFYENDMAKYADGRPAPNPPLKLKKPGFYNLVVMVSSSAHASANASLEIKVPLDFLMYLYPPMHYCSSECAPKYRGSNSITTFRSDKGVYGDPGVLEGAATWQYFGTGTRTKAPGTGRCTICGGGEELSTVFNPQAFCTPPTSLDLRLGTECTGGCPGVRVDSSQRPVNFTLNCVKLPTVSGTAKSILPANGACKRNTAPKWVYRRDTGSPDDTPNSDPKDAPLMRARLRYLRGSNVSFNLVARDDDDCVELSIQTVGYYFTSHASMDLSPPTRDNTATEIGKQIRSAFSWTLDGSGIDDRPDAVTVCFYAFDGYLLSRFFCSYIELFVNSPPPSPPPPSPPPPPACNPYACEVPWTNCLQVHEPKLLECRDGVLCPKDHWRCGTRDAYVCFDPRQNSCVNNKLTDQPAYSDFSAVKNCTASCLIQDMPCQRWENCGYFDRSKYNCIDGILCPKGTWRCGEAVCYYPGTTACTVDKETGKRILTEDLRLDGFGTGPCSGPYPIPAFHGCKKQCAEDGGGYGGCQQEIIYDKCDSPYSPDEHSCIDGFLCPAHACRLDYKGWPGCHVAEPATFDTQADILRCMGRCHF